MKKVTLLSIVLILLAVSVVPVMAAGGQPNGHGNGNSAGQGNGGGNGDHQKQQDRDRDKDQDRNQDGDKNSNPSSGGNGNQGHGQVRGPFYLQGTISGIAGETIMVTLTHGNAKVKEYIGTDLTLQTNESTQIFQITQGDEISGTVGTDVSTGSETNDEGAPSNRIPITFDQLTVGQKVAIHGNLSDSVYTARLITVYIRVTVEQPEIEEP
jgi:hypothetical protein